MFYDFAELLSADVKYSLRMLRKSPIATLVAVLTIAVGVGATSAVFTVVESVLLKPLSCPNCNVLLAVNDEDRRTGSSSGTSIADFLAYKNEAKALDHLAGYRISSFSLGGDGVPEQVTGSVVTQDFFAALGITAALGRTFEGTDADGTIVLSQALWRAQFRGDSSIVGKSVMLDGKASTIVGVAPAECQFPERKTQAWRLVTQDYELARMNSNYRFLSLVGCLRPHTDIREARAQLDVLNQRLLDTEPTRPRNTVVNVVPLRDRMVRNVRQSLLTVMAAAGIVLLICCVNVASLQLSRMAHRTREVAIRGALGASIRRIFGQLVIENLLLSATGGICGLLLALVCLRIVSHFSLLLIPRASEVSVDTTVLAFTAVITVVVGLTFGVVQGVHVLREDLAPSLNANGRGTVTPGGTGWRTQEALVVVEIGAATILLAGVLLILQSFERLSAVDIGFPTEGLLTATLRLQRTAYPDIESLNRHQQDILVPIGDLAGVDGVAAMSHLPLVTGFLNFFVIRGDPEPKSGDRSMVLQCAVSSGYFRVMKIPVLAGREFEKFDSPDSEKVAIVNESLAREYWPNESAIGKQVRHGVSRERTSWYTIVGVVGDIRHIALDAKPRPTLFTPSLQVPHGYENLLGRSVTLFIRTRLDPSSLTPAVRSALAKSDPTVGAEIRPMRAVVSEVLGQPKARTLLFGLFGVIAYWLSALGIYGIISNRAARLRPEIGIRIALGAESRHVLTFVFGSLAQLLAIGLALGIAGSLIGTRWLQGLLFNVSVADPWALSLAVTSLMAASLFGAYLPARQAARINPLDVIRNR